MRIATLFARLPSFSRTSFNASHRSYLLNSLSKAHVLWESIVHRRKSFFRNSRHLFTNLAAIVETKSGSCQLRWFGKRRGTYRVLRPHRMERSRESSFPFTLKSGTLSRNWNSTSGIPARGVEEEPRKWMQELPQAGGDGVEGMKEWSAQREKEKAALARSN